jgi:outer membrane protein OmpA-like peptidoglycan-associated protein
MLDFLAHLWPWLAACLAIGAATGAFLHGGTLRRRPARWLAWFGAAAVAGAAAVLVGAAQGRAAVAVEAALACFAAFVFGAGLLAMRRGALADHERWAVGLLPVALLWWGAVQIAIPAYEREVRERLAALAQGAGMDPAAFEVSGRDVTAPRAAADKNGLIGQIAATPGVRRVSVAAAEPGPTAAPATAPTDQTATIAAPAPGPAPSEGAKNAAAPATAPATAAATAPGPAADAPAAPAGETGKADCQRGLDAAAVSEPVLFPSSRTTINRRAAYALDKAAEAIRRCPQDATIEVRAYADAGAEDEPLARRRALAAERYLRREGVGGRKLVATGCCAGAQEARRGAGAVDYILR